ncbi:MULTISPECIES: hypothetical protein [unclassified Bradyrhizobium]|uniref:hypothetical protein n=1 Tax=unclassified Bradyrhizobium TaxID=2631580 RepID=UPI0029162571|nr:MULTISPECIES: hypothetical protein [unclassified Bradyrhizobium]
MPSDVFRFFEKDRFGIRTGRQLLITPGVALPPAAHDCRWSQDTDFDAMEEQSNSSGFALVLAAVEREGFAIVARTASK